MTDFSEPTTATGSTWIRCYSPDGYQMAVTLPITSVADALRHLADIRAAGLTATLPVDGGLESGESAETITMAVKRMKKNRKEETRPIIDVYWDGAGFKFVSIYLDTDEQIADFEAVSGLKVKDMPKYPSTAPLTAGDEETREFEVKVKTPFIAIRKPADKEVDINGKMVRPWHFVRYGTLATQAPAPVNAAPKAPIIPIDEHNFGHRAPDTRRKNEAPPAQTAPDGTGFTKDTAFEFVSHWFKQETLSTESILKALGIEAFGEWKQTVADAHARVAQAVHALKDKAS